MAFENYPYDLLPDEEIKYHKAVDMATELLETTEPGVCWLPLLPMEETGKTYFFGYKDVQHACMILNGPIRDPQRKYCKLITLCPHEDCCNPEHMLLVNKRNDLINTLREIFGDDEQQWLRMRDMVATYEQIRCNQIAATERKLATAGLPPNALKAAAKLHAELTQQPDWAFNCAVFAFLGRDTNMPKMDKFFLYLNGQGLLTAYYELPKKWKEAISAMLECPYVGREFDYYSKIMQYVASVSGAERLRSRLRALGLEGEYEEYAN